MLSDKGFDLWADGYDKSVGLADETDSYPFAGYRRLLNMIYNDILSRRGRDVLDIGFGTGTLAAKLYAQGCHIYGQDFSERMIELAAAKMPDARLYQGDFSKSLVEPLCMRKYDAIVATYSLHHLSDEEKVEFISVLLPLLKENGRIYIGDVAFAVREDLEACRAACGDEWDPDEIYFVFEELKPFFENLTFEKVSSCAGILTLSRE